MAQTPEIVDLEQTPTAVVRGSASMQEIRDFYDRSFGLVGQAVAQRGVTPSAAFGLYLSPPTDHVELEVGFVVDGAFEAQGEVVPSSLPAGRAARVTHVGGYDDLGSSWERLMSWVTEQGLSPAGPMWEVYVTEPTPQTDPATLRTDLYCLVA